MTRLRRGISFGVSSIVGIQGLIDAINKLNASMGGLASYLFSDNEAPAGSINGVNKDFILANAPDSELSLRVYLNGVYQSPGGEDYTLSNITITFINAPLATSVLRVFYRYK